MLGNCNVVLSVANSIGTLWKCPAICCLQAIDSHTINCGTAWLCENIQPFAVRLSREKRCKGLQLSYSYSAPRAQSTDWRRRPDSRVQHCRFHALLSGAPSATFDKLQGAQNNLTRVVCQSRGRSDARTLLHSLHWLPVRQRVTYKLAVLTHKVRTTATPTYLSELVQTRAPPRAALFRCSDARHSSHTHRTGPSRFFCCCSIHLELSTCWHSTVRKHSHFQTPLENPSIQTHLELLCCIKRLCIFGPKCAIQIRYYYYYYYYDVRDACAGHKRPARCLRQMGHQYTKPAISKSIYVEFLMYCVLALLV